MKIWIDSREQNPLEFKEYNIITEVITSKLEVGDYAIKFEKGFVPAIRFERKSITDLYGTLGKGHERFKKEIERANKFETKLILLIEGTLTKVLKGHNYSNINPNSIVKTIFSLWERYNVYPIFCNGREECSRYIVEIGSAIGRKALNDIKEYKKKNILIKNIDKQLLI